MNTNYPIAIIADIHGNRWALEAVLHDIEQKGIQLIVNLGDSLLGPLDPVGTANILIEQNIVSIRGNDDRVLLSPPADMASTQAFVQERLSDIHLQWLSKLQAMMIVDEKIFACHATPTSDDTYLLEKVTHSCVNIQDTQTLTTLVQSVAQSVILCGHSHLPRTIFLLNGKLIVNPGSVGVPAYTASLPYPHAMESGSPHAKYAILTQTDNSWQVKHILVPYDWEQAANVAKSYNRPEWARWIATGRV